MSTRKIAAAAGFACGAAVAFAPLAAADLGDTVDATRAFEIGSQNQIFELQALFAGADVTKATVAGQYDTLTHLNTDAPYLVPGDSTLGTVGDTYGEVTPLETEIYGANPILAGISGTTGPYNEFNGATTEFYNAYNVYAFAAANGGMLDKTPGDYLGSETTNALAVGGNNATVSSAAQFFLERGFGDLKGFDAIFAPDSTGVGDIHPYIANEIVQLNNLFELDGKLAGVYDDIMPNINSTQGTYVSFDTIDPTKTNDAFDSLVFGASVPSDDPGSYDVFNGALTEFFNASNVGLYALLNNGMILPDNLLFGPHFDFLDGTVTQAISAFTQLGFSDLAGYFIPAAMSG